MRSPALLLALSLLPLAPLVASGAHAPLPVPDGRFFADAAGLHAPADVLDARLALARAAAHPADPALHAAAVQALARAAPGQRIASSPLAIAGTGIALPAGDATGDGLSEALLVVASGGGRGGSTLGLHILAPGVGELWNVSFGSRIVDYAPGNDLDGDGRTDLLVVTMDAKALAGDVSQFDWKTRAFRGSDGALLWERDAASVDAPAPLSTGVVDLYAEANAVATFAVVGGDADGDGGADVWLDEVSIAFSAAGTPVGGIGVAAVADQARVLSGSDGSVLATLPLLGGPGGFALALPSGDLDGDRLADTVATASQAGADGAAGALVAAFTGAGAPLWAHPVPGAVALGVPVPDLDGDGLADVLADERADGAKVREGLRGAQGATLWSFPDPAYFWTVPGHVAGAANDVQFLDGVWDPGAQGTEVRAALVRGDTGALVYDTRPLLVPLPGNGYSSIGFVVPAGDLDGDGVQDLLLDTETGLLGDPSVRLTSDAHLVRAADGQLAWSRLGTDLLAIPALGDVTGDGRDDAVLQRTGGAPVVATLTALDGPTGADAWSRSITAAELAGFAFRGGADFGGSAAGDLLLTLVSGGKGSDHAATSVEAWAGPDGSTVWAP
ncbi:MAG: hypothetical protein LC624_02210 [Halobacteriales archaeon]|nr:hypothetical protein [Halobacteriales archaeon]